MVLLVIAAIASADEKAPAPREIIEPKPSAVDVSGFRTVETAIQTKIAKTLPKAAAQPGYLGVQLDSAEKGKFVIGFVEPDSPAAAAKLQKGDIIQKIDSHIPVDAIQFRELLQAKAPGENAKLSIQRSGKPMEIVAVLAATSRPMPLMNSRADLGIRASEEEDGLRVDRVFPSSPAQGAGLKSGDLIMKVDQTLVHAGLRISDVIAEKVAGETVTLRIRRDSKEIDLSVKVPKVEVDTSRMSWDARSLSTWKKDVYHLAVLIIEYPDAEHNAKITPKDWETAFFSRNSYNDKSVTGQKVYGSVNDYYHEISSGKLRVEGKVFEPVKVSKKRSEYMNDTNRLGLLTEAIDKLLARDGKEALKDFDGLCFIYSGSRVQTNRGGLYWPHRASVNHNGKRWPYYICPEGGGTMTNISVFCHEFGHMLGLPDLYARPENPGSEGVGVWCAMSNQSGGGRPQHFSAWSKEQLGWLQPAVIDPTVKQKLILSPVETSPKECFKVLIRTDGSEYLLLENRQRKGYDTSLPGDGLLIWRILDGKPFLEESHGISGPSGPRSYLSMVPFPSKANNAFTPYTTPSSKSQKGGGLPVSITNIHRLSDGRITFFIGYESY